MSVKVMALVWEWYPVGGGEFLVALKLADHSDHDGNNIFPSVALLADLTRQSERSVQRHQRRMEQRGWLLPDGDQPIGRGGTRRWRIPVELIPQGVISRPQKRVTICHPSAEKRVTDCHPSEPERVTTTVERVTTTVGKGDTAMSPEPSVTINQQQPSVATRPAGKAKGKTHLPADFSISDAIRAWATARGYLPFLMLHFDYFVDYAKSNAAKYDDWDSAFRNCIRSDWGGVRRSALKSGFRPAEMILCTFTVGREACGLPAKDYGGTRRCDHHKRIDDEATRRPIPAAAKTEIDRLLKKGRHNAVSD
jgi:hypothetical protein